MDIVGTFVLITVMSLATMGGIGGGGDGAAEGTSHLGFLESDPIDKSLTGERFLSVLSGDGGAVLGERRLSRRAGIAEA